MALGQHISHEFSTLGQPLLQRGPTTEEFANQYALAHRMGFEP